MLDSPDCSFDRITDDLALVSTIDFFYPLVDDPYEQGRIGAANVLSDLFAAGVHEIRNGLMVLAVSSQMKKADQKTVTNLIIKGFNDAFQEAGANITGGQTIFNDAPIIGGVALGLVRGKDPYTPRNAKAGDVLVLTKPLGAQIVVNVNQYMRNNDEKWKALEASGLVERESFIETYLSGVEFMGRLNKTASVTMQKHGVTSSTDITGFGILGHAQNIAELQHEAVDYVLDTFPTYRGMAQIDGIVRNFNFVTGYAPETSGGLLISLPPENVDAFIQDMHEQDENAWVVGKVVAGNRTARLGDELTILEVI